AGLRLKPSKCHLLCSEVDFLGHVVSAEGVKTDSAKIEKVTRRENVHRDHVEDDRLVQIYLRRESNAKYHFVYQSYFATRHRALQICKELQLWIDGAQSSEA
ncbi:MAG: hypothetical protein AAF394_06120, partial [Planctomycetota bacterium]